MRGYGLQPVLREHAVLSEGAGSGPSCHSWPLPPLLLLGSQPGGAILPPGAPWEGVSHSAPLLSSQVASRGQGHTLVLPGLESVAQAGTFPDSGGQEDFTCRTRCPAPPRPPRHKTRRRRRAALHTATGILFQVSNPPCHWPASRPRICCSEPPFMATGWVVSKPLRKASGIMRSDLCGWRTDGWSEGCRVAVPSPASRRVDTELALPTCAASCPPPGLSICLDAACF